MYVYRNPKYLPGQPYLYMLAFMRTLTQYQTFVLRGQQSGVHDRGKQFIHGICTFTGIPCTVLANPTHAHNNIAPNVCPQGAAKWCS
jgi:hypothetical protein